jgi:hypothetical protein
VAVQDLANHPFHNWSNQTQTTILHPHSEVELFLGSEGRCPSNSDYRARSGRHQSTLVLALPVFTGGGGGSRNLF